MKPNRLLSFVWLELKRVILREQKSISAPCFKKWLNGTPRLTHAVNLIRSGVPLLIISESKWTRLQLSIVDLCATLSVVPLTFKVTFSNNFWPYSLDIPWSCQCLYGHVHKGRYGHWRYSISWHVWTIIHYFLCFFSLFLFFLLSCTVLSVSGCIGMRGFWSVLLFLGCVCVHTHHMVYTRSESSK